MISQKKVKKAMEKHFEKLFTALENHLNKNELLAKTDFEKIREIRLTVNLPIEIITEENRFYINIILFYLALCLMPTKTNSFTMQI